MVEQHREMAGVILVGGKSRRMGQDKALLPFGGRPLFERVLEAHRRLFSHTILVGDRPERFRAHALPVFEDLFPGSALGGLYTGLVCADTKWVFVTACDLPFPDWRVMEYLVSLKEGFDAVVPMTAKGPEPLFAVYSASCLEPIRRMLYAGNFRIYDLYPEVRVRYVPPEELTPLDSTGRTFLNLNTVEDLDRIIREDA